MDEERGEQSPIEGRNIINVDKNENNDNDDDNDNDHDDTVSLLVSKGHHQEYCNSVRVRMNLIVLRARTRTVIMMRRRALFLHHQLLLKIMIITHAMMMTLTPITKQ